MPIYLSGKKRKEKRVKMTGYRTSIFSAFLAFHISLNRFRSVRYFIKLAGCLGSVGSTVLIGLAIKPSTHRIPIWNDFPDNPILRLSMEIENLDALCVSVCICLHHPIERETYRLWPKWESGWETYQFVNLNLQIMPFSSSPPWFPTDVSFHEKPIHPTPIKGRRKPWKVVRVIAFKLIGRSRFYGRVTPPLISCTMDNLLIRIVQLLTLLISIVLHDQYNRFINSIVAQHLISN